MLCEHAVSHNRIAIDGFHEKIPEFSADLSQLPFEQSRFDLIRNAL